MTIRQTALGTLQRDALVIANHGPLGMVKGLKAQAAALVKKGYLSEDLSPTEKGREAYAEMAALRSWGDSRTDLERDLLRQADRNHFWGSEVFGRYSEDRETVYVTRIGRSSEVVAFRAASITPHALRALGLEDAAEVVAA